MLFTAYLQGRNSIYNSMKWEELENIGKYRVIKNFLKWYLENDNFKINI
jgi:hypothetical protein